MDEDDESDFIPPEKPVNVGKILLICAWVATLLGIAGVVLWLVLAKDSIMAEIDAQRPQMRMSVANALSRTEPSPAPPAAPHNPQQPSPDAPKAQAEPPPSSNAAPAEPTAVLHPHPDPALIEQSDLGPLPKIDAEGREPWKVYGRPFSRLDQRPRIAIILTGMGVSASTTQSAITDTPGPVSFAFQPFARDLGSWVDRTRAAGHEVLLNLPLEPVGFPRNDPGPYALLTGAKQEENQRRLDWILSRMTGYVGVLNFMGSKFTADEAAVRDVVAALKRRGLMVVDARETPLSVVGRVAKATGLPIATVDSLIDGAPNRASIDERLSELETKAANAGSAVGIARAYPITLERLKRWADGLAAKGFVLAPVSAVAVVSSAPGQ
ncbi:MAG: divergent polysaccharide deacetylase family protein [Alphaproteobacteria bacterium]